MPNLPKVEKPDLIFYHWSPSKNRGRILKEGLCPGKLNLTREWRPPYVCFSDDPLLAWQLSGRMYPEIPSWDLWQCYAEFNDSFDHWEAITDTYRTSGRTYIKEYRVYSRVYKRDLRFVGSRLW